MKLFYFRITASKSFLMSQGFEIGWMVSIAHHTQHQPSLIFGETGSYFLQRMSWGCSAATMYDLRSFMNASCDCSSELLGGRPGLISLHRHHDRGDDDGGKMEETAIDGDRVSDYFFFLLRCCSCMMFGLDSKVVSSQVFVHKVGSGRAVTPIVAQLLKNAC